MSATEAEAQLGAPLQTAERAEGTLRVVTRTYRSDAGEVSADFVEDVLIRFSITSN